MAAFRVRLRVRVGKRLNSTNDCETVEVSGKTVTIKGDTRGQILRESYWLALCAYGFASEDEAREFGELLRVKVQVAALASRLGVDTGLDQPTFWVSDDFARAVGMLKEGDRLFPNVHGVSVMPDDENNRIPTGGPTIEVHADPAQFMESLAGLPATMPGQLVAANGMRLMNFALLTNDPLAQLVLAFSAVEELGQGENWTSKQRQLLNDLEQLVRATSDDADHTEVADAIKRSMHRIGIRQGVMRVLDCVGLKSLRKEWDRLYGLRSGLFHGTALLPAEQISQLALDAVTLCGRILLTQLAKDGVPPPTIAKTHFAYE
jgi:hypothetical protein